MYTRNKPPAMTLDDGTVRFYLHLLKTRQKKKDPLNGVKLWRQNSRLLKENKNKN